MRVASVFLGVVAAWGVAAAGQAGDGQPSLRFNAPSQKAIEAAPELIGLPPVPPGAVPLRTAARVDAEIKAEPAHAGPLPKVEPVIERFANGKVKVERHVIQDAGGNYVNHGPYTEYNLEGKAIKSGEFLHGRQIGGWTQTIANSDGSLFAGGLGKDFAPPFTSEAPFDDGKLQGVWTIKDSAGHVVAEWNFDRGIRNGASTWYHPNGQKRLEASYRSGALGGEVTEWDADGKAINQNTYVDDRLVAKTFGWYAPGQKHFEGCYLRAQNVPEPQYDWWTSSIKPRATGPSGEDQKHGLWVSWYRNGNKKSEGQYDRGVLVGKFTWWYENGQKQAEGEYSAGQRTGVWITWHPNGLKETQAEYVDGRMAGKWQRWDIDGKLVESRDAYAAPRRQQPQRQNVGAATQRSRR